MKEKKMGLFERAITGVGEKLEKMAVGSMCLILIIYEPELPVAIIDELCATE